MPTATERKVSAHQAVRKVINRTNGRPISHKQIVDRVLATPGVELQGLTPRATISAVISRAEKDGEIARVERGLYRKV